jgi:type I restriction enzyme R subunit
VGDVEEHTAVVEWKQKVNVQKRLRKEIKLRLYKTGWDISESKRDELTNRVIELARAHYTA